MTLPMAYSKFTYLHQILIKIESVVAQNHEKYFMPHRGGRHLLVANVVSIGNPNFHTRQLCK